MGQAFAEWVRIWNRHGYAAIAMDLSGHVPQTEPYEPPDLKKEKGISGPGRVIKYLAISMNLY